MIAARLAKVRTTPNSKICCLTGLLWSGSNLNMTGLRSALAKKQTSPSIYGETERDCQLAIVWFKRHLHIVSFSESVGRVDIVVDRVVMLKMMLSSDDISHHLLG